MTAMNNQLKNKKSSFIAKILNDVKCGLYAGGDKLPSERKLCDTFAVSRTTVREVLGELLAAGILERHGRNALISDSALRLIENNVRQANLHLAFIMPAAQLENPIIRIIFNTIIANIGDAISMKVVFLERYLSENMSCLNNVDLAIVAGDWYDDFGLDAIRRQCQELILVNAHHERYNYIIPDNYAGGRLMAQLLYENHHVSVGTVYLAGDRIDEFAERYNGARDFFNEHDIVMKSSPATLATKSEFPSIIYHQAFEYLYKQDPNLTSILCFKDEIALVLYELLEARKIRIPDDISIIGFDDQLYSSFVSPALTTVRYPVESIGLEVVNAINRMYREGSVGIQKAVVPTLLKRDSVKDIGPR